MMKRIYFLVPDIATTKKIVDDLKWSGIEEKQIHVLAKSGTPLEELPDNILTSQKSDFIPAVEKGLERGGKTGLLVGLVAIALPPASLVIAGGVLLAAMAAGAVNIADWIREMVGISADSQQIKEFENEIAKGQLLVLADVPSEEVDKIKLSISQHLPETEVKSTEPKM